MNESARLPRRVHQLAGELLGLFERQIETLRDGLNGPEVAGYLARRRQIQELKVELKLLCRQAEESNRPNLS
jgi:hypothetical protein